MDDSNSIVLAEWMEHRPGSLLPGLDMKGYMSRVVLQCHAARGGEIYLYVERTVDEVSRFATVPEDQWGNVRTALVNGAYLLETLLEWGVPLPPPTERRDDV